MNIAELQCEILNAILQIFSSENLEDASCEHLARALFAFFRQMCWHLLGDVCQSDELQGLSPPLCACAPWIENKASGAATALDALFRYHTRQKKKATRKGPRGYGSKTTLLGEHYEYPVSSGLFCSHFWTITSHWIPPTVPVVFADGDRSLWHSLAVNKKKRSRRHGCRNVLGAPMKIGLRTQ